MKQMGREEQVRIDGLMEGIPFNLPSTCTAIVSAEVLCSVSVNVDVASERSECT